MSVQAHPRWWNKEYESAWDRVKDAVKRDWDQTMHDFGAEEPDTNQNVGDTIAQAAGKQPIPPRGVPTYDEAEPAYRFGYIARMEFGDEYDDWNDEVASRMREEWDEMEPADPQSWERNRRSVRAGWNRRDRES